MKIVNSFKLSINSIIHRRLRSWLTLLGIVIGVAAVVAIVSIGEGAQASISEELAGFGADVITVSPGFSRTSSFGGGFRERFPGMARGGIISEEKDDPTLTEKDSRIIGQNQNVTAVLERTNSRGSFVFLAEELGSVTISGVNPLSWKEIESPELSSGRLLTPSDSGAIVITGELAEDAFKQPITLGRRATIEEEQFMVVGILEKEGSSDFGRMGGGNNKVYMTNDAVWRITDDDELEKNTFSSISVKVSDISLIGQTMGELEQSLLVLRNVSADTKDFSISSSLEMQEQISSTMESVTLFLGAIAAVSLIVGAVGVANSMFTSVLEKTKLIGILKALGSTNSEILTVFIIESGLFGLLGGIIGVLLGSAISGAMSNMVGISLPMMGRGGMGGMMTLVTPELMGTAILLSTAIGIASGILPARAAAKLKPVEALRYE